MLENCLVVDSARYMLAGYVLRYECLLHKSRNRHQSLLCLWSRDQTRQEVLPSHALRLFLGQSLWLGGGADPCRYSRVALHYTVSIHQILMPAQLPEALLQEELAPLV
jgi:hypothetical protein